MKLSILIPTLKSRADKLSRLLTVLRSQANEKTEIIYDCDEGVSSIGNKRNNLIKIATGDYIAFIDDDDDISSKYIPLVLSAIKNNPDCCSLTGIYSVYGIIIKPFIHSIKHDHYWEDEAAFYRPPNHLNVIRREIAQQFVFPEINHGEDTDWAMQICRAGVLKKEAEIKEILYHYNFISKK